MVAFNIANYTLAGAAAHAIVHLQGAFGSNWSPNLESALALGAAAIAFVLINHALIVLVVTLARGRSLRRSIDDMVACLPIDTALALTGACFAALWAFTPPLALLAAGPMVLIYRALWVPLLEHKSRTDPKTGLYNSEYFGNEVEDALEAASRSGSRLSIVMIDLDQLRVINNRHGHLAARDEQGNATVLDVIDWSADDIAMAQQQCANLLSKVDPSRASWSRASWSRASWSTSFDK